MGGFEEVKEKFRSNVGLVAIVVVIVLVYIFIAVFFGGDRKMFSNKYLISGNYLIWHKVGNKYYQVKEVSEKVTNHKYTVYNNFNKFEATSSQFLSNNWHFFDKDSNEISDDNFQIAYTGVKNIKALDYETEGYDSYDERILRNTIKDYSQFDSLILDLFRESLVKIPLDLDNDGEEETIYAYTSYRLDTTNYVPYSYLVLVKNDEIVDKIETTDENTFEVMNILDLDNDGKYEMIVGRAILDLPTFESCYQIYNVEGNKLKLRQDCIFE